MLLLTGECSASSYLQGWQWLHTKTAKERGRGDSQAVQGAHSTSFGTFSCLKHRFSRNCIGRREARKACDLLLTVIIFSSFAIQLLHSLRVLRIEVEINITYHIIVSCIWPRLMLLENDAYVVYCKFLKPCRFCGNTANTAALSLFTEDHPLCTVWMFASVDKTHSGRKQ